MNLPVPARLNILSHLNPIIKGPLEQATGGQLNTGRRPQDVYAQTGSQALDRLIMSSPVGRVLTPARTLADPRKDWGTALATPEHHLLWVLAVGDDRSMGAVPNPEVRTQWNPSLGRITRSFFANLLLSWIIPKIARRSPSVIV
jgi:hypothetical protein